ncbi:MAG: arsenate reductase (glutaredoxin) [Pelagibacterales bacterium]|nr:arsenate reductase (glutaredoxin) [Pelagibacterales bacterium]PPR15702.1 MAG: Arsenate reductase [Alphaproteobacteria bacterium MarineAlpha9_Bin3]|tara:strand:+ start:410 stop:745 length:336 start_codon:yes stop_codon:yes gene_type:complete
MEILHNPRCSKSRATLNIILENNIKPTIRLYLDNPLSVKEIKVLLKKLSAPVDKIIRKNEEIYKKLDLKNADKSLLIEKISKNPILLERPIVIEGENAIIGRPPENVKELF